MLPTCIEQKFQSLDHLFEVLARDYWGRAPVMFRNHGLGSFLGDEATICAGLLANSQRGVEPRVYADERWADSAPPHEFTTADGSIRDYVERLAKHHGAQELLVVTDRFEASSPEVWFSCTPAVQALFRSVGFPAGRAQVNVFAGRYARTPFKFHKDIADSLTYVLQGQKRYFIWPFEDIATRMRLPPDARHENIRFDSFDYTAIEHQATALDTLPGDLVYWPWDCFHLAKPRDASFSVAISFGIAPFSSPFENLDAVAQQSPAAHRSAPFRSGPQTQSDNDAVNAAREALDDEDVAAYLRQQTLVRRSRLGFLGPLPLADASSGSFDEGDVVESPARDLINWALDGERVRVAVNGHSFSVDPVSGLLETFEALNAGGSFVVERLRSLLCGNDLLETAELDELLRCLMRMQAIQLQPRPRATEAPNLLRYGVGSSLFDHSGAFPLRLLDGGRTFLMAMMDDASHRRIEGFETRAFRIPVQEVLELDRGPRVQPRYIFTGGYSGSTLLCRALDTVPSCLCLHEPRVLSDWSLEYGRLADPIARSEMRSVLPVVTDLLFGTRDVGRRPVVKVGAHVQEVLDLLMVKGARGLHLYTDLPSFLANTLKDPRRRTDLRAVAEAPERARVQERLGLKPIDARRLADGEAIACTWLTDLALHAATRCGTDMLRAVSLDDLLENPDGSMRAVVDHLKLGDPHDAGLPWQAVFTRHAKRPGEAFDSAARRTELDLHSAEHRSEIEGAMEWARTWLGRELPLRLDGDVEEYDGDHVGVRAGSTSLESSTDRVGRKGYENARS